MSGPCDHEYFRDLMDNTIFLTCFCFCGVCYDHTYYVREGNGCICDECFCRQLPNEDCRATTALLVPENAEHLPYVDGYFDVVTSVYLFHELPRNARRNVVREMFRVLQPGGLLVIEDSAQTSDSPALVDVLGGFPEQYHEPFYNEYIRDDLADLLAECGFHVASSEPHLVAKVVVATKPG